MYKRSINPNGIHVHALDIKKGGMFGAGAGIGQSPFNPTNQIKATKPKGRVLQVWLC